MTVDVGDYDGERRHEAIGQAVREAIAEAQPVGFYDCEARYGQFPDLEQFCRDHGLSYVRHSSAKYEYDAIHEWWTPGMSEPVVCTSNQSGDVLVRVGEIKPILEAEEVGAQAKVDGALAYLRSHAPPEIPPLRSA